MGSIDALGDAWTPSAALTMLRRAFGSRVVRDPRRPIGGVNVGAVTGPARGIRYEAVFVAGAAERVFPAVGRQDPLLTDDERAAINDRVPQAMALQRDRADSDRHAWELARRAAGREFTASWSRRSSAVGGPARPSSLILETVADRTIRQCRIDDHSDSGPHRKNQRVVRAVDLGLGRSRGRGLVGRARRPRSAQLRTCIAESLRRRYVSRDPADLARV